MPGLKAKSKNSKPHQLSSPLVSIIIAAYNEKDHIGKLLESIKLQDYPHLEILVVDDASTDNTVEIAKKYTARVYCRPHCERSVQRNFGARQAKGQYLLFLDADMQLTSAVVSACVNLRKQVVVIPEKSYGQNYWAKCKALERNCYIGDTSIEAARFVDKAIFIKIGGYNEAMVSGEDWDLHRRLQSETISCGRINNFILHNEGRLSFWKVIKKKYYYAQKSDSYINENINSISDVFKFIFRPSFIKNWRLLLTHPFYTPGMLFLFYSELLVGGLGAVIFKPAFLKKLHL